MDRKGWKYFVKVPFANNRLAIIAKNSLEVDREPRKEEITRKLILQENILFVNWEASEARLLRVSVNSFFELLLLVLDTIDQFDVSGNKLMLPIGNSVFTKSFKTSMLSQHCVSCNASKILKQYHQCHRQFTSLKQKNHLCFTNSKSSMVSVRYSSQETNCDLPNIIPNMKDGVLLEKLKPKDGNQLVQGKIKIVLSLDDVHELLQELNGQDVAVLELSKKLNYVDYFVIVTAKSPRHLVHMSQTLNQLYKSKKGNEDPFLYIEGKKDSQSWQCIDMGHIVVHFMLPNTRKRYQLEKIWLLGPEYDDLWHETPEEMDPFSILEMDEISEDEDEKHYIAPWEISYGPSRPRVQDNFDEDDYVI